MSDREHRIRDRAFQLWEQAGRPHHRSDEFWIAAEAELTEAESAGPKAIKKAATKAKEPDSKKLAEKPETAPAAKPKTKAPKDPVVKPKAKPKKK